MPARLLRLSAAPKRARIGSSFVVPAKAGIQWATTRGCRPRNPACKRSPGRRQSRMVFWILAFARMTSGCVSRLEVGRFGRGYGTHGLQDIWSFATRGTGEAAAGGICLLAMKEARQ